MYYSAAKSRPCNSLSPCLPASHPSRDLQCVFFFVTFPFKISMEKPPRRTASRSRLVLHPWAQRRGARISTSIFGVPCNNSLYSTETGPHFSPMEVSQPNSALRHAYHNICRICPLFWSRCTSRTHELVNPGPTAASAELLANLLGPIPCPGSSNRDPSRVLPTNARAFAEAAIIREKNTPAAAQHLFALAYHGLCISSASQVCPHLLRTRCNIESPPPRLGIRLLFSNIGRSMSPTTFVNHLPM